MLAERFCGR